MMPVVSNQNDNGEVATTRQRAWTTARKIALGDRSIRSRKIDKDVTILTFQILIERIYGFSVEQLDVICDTSMYKQQGLDFALDKLFGFADLKTLKECGFNKKKVALRLCWPEYFYTKYHQPTDYDLFFMRDTKLKADLVSHSSLAKVFKENGEIHDGKKMNKACKYGEDIDKWLYNAFNRVWNDIFESSTTEMFIALANYKRSVLGTSARCLDVVMRRGIYPSPLDWYMWNSPEQFQIEHCKEYLKIRKAAHLPQLEYLDVWEQAMQRVYEKNNNMEYER